ncbi:MAG TPA: hypothetical protein VK483_09470 [Chitinophagaceae bacterium]|nr:hypothetical protein [Chitinophagaceae bacterium]
METNIRRYTWLNVLSLLLALPTAYFILISVLKYGLNVDGPYDNATPFLERMGIQEDLGWNINLLILFGPLIAFLLTIFQTLQINWKFSKEEFEFHFTIRKKWFPLAVAVFSGGLLLTLFIYLVGENR